MAHVPGLGRPTGQSSGNSWRGPEGEMPVSTCAVDAGYGSHSPASDRGGEYPDTRRQHGRDAVQSVAAHGDDTEQRLDRSAHDLHRETTFDPAQTTPVRSG
jgi:hypothetical protein